MALKDILLHLDASPRSEVRLGLACGLAQRHGAHLTGLFVMDLPSAAPFYGDPAGAIDPRVIEEVTSKARETALREASRVEAAFRDRLRRDAIEGEWRLAEGRMDETVALHARYADLAVIGQPDPNQSLASSSARILATTLFSSGRPVLIIPYAGDFATLGSTVLVGWKSSPEAARAVNDALPLLQQAGSVTVLAVNPRHGLRGDGDVPAADIALHLARHGITVLADHTVATEVSEGDTLLNRASDLGADLIVIGGYGHSRLRELVFGGVTQTLLTTMTVPVFLSH